MSYNSFENEKKSENKESDISDGNEGEENEEGEEENDKINNDHNNERKKYIIRKKKNKKYEDKQTQHGKLIIKNNKNKTKNERTISDDKDDILKEYKEKINLLEKNMTLMDEKDKTIQKLTKINLKLKNSLELVSKKMDEKIQNVNFYKNKNNNNTVRSLGNLSYENTTKNDFKFGNDFSKKTISYNIIKEKELNNAVNMIKILRSDNQRLQNKIDEIEKNKEMEKQLQDKKQILMQRELQEHKLCKQKIENYQDKIRKLTEKNKNLMDKIVYGKSKKGIYSNINNNASSESDNENGGKNYRIKDQSGFGTNKIIKKGNLFNIRKLMDTRKQNNSLPKINFSNNQLSSANKNSISIININNIFNEDEMLQLNKVFLKNDKVYQIIIKKFEILQKSKESIDNKYRLEQKQFTKRIYSMQQQIDYLNGKIRDGELKINILQAQLNESKLEKKQLLKRVKILSEGFESNGFNLENINNKNEKQTINKRTKNIKFSENKNQDELNIDNSDFKGQKINNSIELGNEGESISEGNFSEETNKNKSIKLNKTNKDDSENNSKLSNN